MLSIIVLNLAKFANILLALVVFVSILLIFNLFQILFSGSIRLKKFPSSKFATFNLESYPSELSSWFNHIDSM